MKKLLPFLFFVSFSFNYCFSQSDGCSAATVIGITANCSAPIAGTTTGATQTIPGCVGNADDDVWYQFTAATTGIQITVAPSAGMDPVVQLFSGNCSALISLVCKDGNLTGGNEVLNYSSLTPGQVYRIRVYDYYAGSGSGNFTICLTPPPSPPANNFCGSPIALPINTTCSFTSGTTDGATQSFPGCSGNADDDVWYSFTATNSLANITVTPIDNLDLVFQVYSGGCGSLNSLLCEDNTFGNQTEQSDVIGLIPGVTYLIRVYDYYEGTTGDFNICITGSGSATPTNDEPCSAIQMPDVTSACNFSQFTTVGATVSTGAGIPTPSSCVGGSGAAIGGFDSTLPTTTRDVWFSIIVPPSGNIDVTPQPNGGGGSISDGVMVLYSGTCGALTQITCSDDHNYPDASNDFLPFISENGLTPGDTVYLRYFGFGTSFGTFGICVSTATNDECANALYICDINGYSGSTSPSYTEDRPDNMHANNETAAGVNLIDGTDSGGPFGDGNPWDASYGFNGSPALDVNIDNNSWIRFTAAATTAVLNVSVYDCFIGGYPAGGIQMQIFEASNCTNFVPVSNFEENSTGFVITGIGLVPGNDYYLMIDGFRGDICSYTISANSGVQFPDIDTTLICPGGSIQLNAPPGASSYFWTHSGEITSSVTVTPVITENYTVEVTGLCDYKQTLTVAVGVNTCSALPIELLSFNVNRINERNVGIYWTTVSEINSDYFEIERSKDGTNFSPILTQKAAGNSINEINYTGNDFEPIEGTSFYRLKQIDFDGTYVYSKIIQLDNSLNGIIIYPNPTEGNININIQRNKTEEVDVFIYNNLGQVSMRKSMLLQKGNSTFFINLNELEKGLYQLKIVDSSGEIKQQKIVLQ